MRFKDDLQKYIHYHGQIDLGYYLLSEMANEISLPKHPLIQVIDKATGASEERYKYCRKQAMKLIRDIIRQKKIFNYDTSRDEEFLQKIKELPTKTVEAKMETAKKELSGRDNSPSIRRANDR